MAEYYFDVATTGTDPAQHEVIAVGLQALQGSRPMGPLSILTQWEYGGERGLLQSVYKSDVFAVASFDYVLVGPNLLRFDLPFLMERMDALGVRPWPRAVATRYLAEKPSLDLRSVLVLLNGRRFDGSGLQNFSRRPLIPGEEVPRMWARRDYRGIETYMRQHAEAFLDIYARIAPRLAEMGRDIKGLPRGAPEPRARAPMPR
jgi:uncharacterized protein YprB with RNaseH-like and TPR domain